jgi:hypothetical protein
MWYHHIHLELAGYKSYLPSIGSARWVQLDYSESNYRLKLGHWRTHELQAHEISPVHYVVLSSDILWLTGYVS